MNELKEKSVTQMVKQPLILAVDDEGPIRKILDVNLSADGYSVITAAEGSQALELLEEHRPDLVLLDIMMPGLDGFEVLELIREHSNLPNVPVIMLTALGEINFLKRALLRGADDYITKPFSLEVLSARINAKLRRVRKRNPENPTPLTGQDNDSRIGLVAYSLSSIGAGDSTAIPGSSARQGFLQQLQSPASGWRLTERETEIISLAAGGASNRQIASELDIAEQTVKNHMTTVLCKLQARNRAHAATMAVRMGLISPR